jgi:L-rhamnose mutarotase
MEHVSFVLQIDPANEAEYRRRHERVDPEIRLVVMDKGEKLQSSQNILQLMHCI